MGKYGNGITIRQQCLYEVAELRARLKAYNVPEEGISEMCKMLVEPYFQMKHLADSGCVLFTFVEESVAPEKLKEFYSASNKDGYMGRMMAYQQKDAKNQFTGEEWQATELASDL